MTKILLSVTPPEGDFAHVGLLAKKTSCQSCYCIVISIGACDESRYISMGCGCGKNQRVKLGVELDIAVSVFLAHFMTIMLH